MSSTLKSNTKARYTSLIKGHREFFAVPGGSVLNYRLQSEAEARKPKTVPKKSRKKRRRHALWAEAKSKKAEARKLSKVGPHDRPYRRAGERPHNIFCAELKDADILVHRHARKNCCAYARIGRAPRGRAEGGDARVAADTVGRRIIGKTARVRGRQGSNPGIGADRLHEGSKYHVQARGQESCVRQLGPQGGPLRPCRDLRRVAAVLLMRTRILQHADKRRPPS